MTYTPFTLTWYKTFNIMALYGHNGTWPLTWLYMVIIKHSNLIHDLHHHGYIRSQWYMTFSMTIYGHNGTWPLATQLHTVTFKHNAMDLWCNDSCISSKLFISVTMRTTSDCWWDIPLSCLWPQADLFLSQNEARGHGSYSIEQTLMIFYTWYCILWYKTIGKQIFNLLSCLIVLVVLWHW